MSNSKRINYYDFSGGLNVTSPESKLEPNEFRRMMNLVPGLYGHELMTRPILSPSVWDELVRSSYTPSEQTLYAIGIVHDMFGEEHLWMAYSDGENVVARDVSHGGQVILKAGGAEDPQVEFMDFRTNAVIVMCGNTNCTSYRVQYFPDDDIGGFVNDLDDIGTPVHERYVVKIENTNVPDGVETYPINASQIVEHGGRIFGIDENGYAIFCGVSLDTPDFLNWGQFWGNLATGFSDPTDDGGQVGIEPIKSKITRLEPTPDGIIVFKESSISFWTYPPDSHPADASSGAEIINLSNTVGCVDPGSVVNVGGATLFVGNATGGVRSLYVLRGTEIEKVSDRVDRIWMEQDGAIQTAVSGGIVYFFTDKGMFMLMNTESGAFSECSNTEMPEVLSVVRSQKHHLLAGWKSGRGIFASLLRIPTTSEQVSSDEITAELLTARIYPDEPTSDIRTNKLYISHKFFDTMSARVESMEGISLYDHVNSTYTNELGEGSFWAMLRHETPPANVSFMCGDIDSGYYDTHSEERVFVSARYDEPYEADVHYDGGAEYFSSDADVIGYYLNRKTDRLSTKISIKTRGKYAMDGFSILFKESGEIDKPKNST